MGDREQSSTGRDTRRDDSAGLDGYVKDVAGTLPPLTETQRHLLALIFRSGHPRRVQSDAENKCQEVPNCAARLPACPLTPRIYSANQGSGVLTGRGPRSLHGRWRDLSRGTAPIPCRPGRRAKPEASVPIFTGSVRHGGPRARHRGADAGARASPAVLMTGHWPAWWRHEHPSGPAHASRRGLTAPGRGTADSVSAGRDATGRTRISRPPPEKVSA